MASRANSRRATTLRETLAGPLAIVITIPALVLAVGGFVTWNAWTHSSRVVDTMVRQQFDETAGRVQAELGEVKRQGEAVLGAIRHQLGRMPQGVDAEAFAWVLRDQFAGRGAVAYLGLGTAGGDFYGISRTDPDEAPFFTRRLRDHPGDPTCRLVDFAFGEDGRLLPAREESAYAYDPRVRPWYVAARRAEGRVVTGPYVGYDAGVGGGPMAEPYRLADGTEGVIQVEFNVNSLSSLVETLGRRNDVIPVIHTATGEILAMPSYRQEGDTDQAGRGEIRRGEDIEHPAIAAYFADRSEPGADGLRAVDVAGERFLVATRDLALPGGAVWRTSCIGSLDARLAASRAEVRQAGIAVAIALAVACALAALFARNIVATHLRATRAEAEAAEARDAVRQIGAYHLYRVLGEGGMGEVWLAEHGLLARPVAVKLIHARFWGEVSQQERDIAIARFQREARTLAQLQSPHTITIYDFGVSDDGDLFYAMELLDGMDLYDLVGTYGPQPLGRVVDILLQAARSLGEAHDRGLVHRDIKPANIYLCRQADVLDLVKVLDFGMVRRVREAEDPELTVQGTVEGTPPYMAPEQVRDKDDADGRLDLYALALVGYYLLSGSEPMVRESTVKTVQAHLNDPPPRVSELALQVVPEALDELLVRCLAKDPDDRPATMAVFIQALEAIPIPPERQWVAGRRAAWWDAVPRPDLSFGTRDRSTAKDLHKRRS